MTFEVRAMQDFASMRPHGRFQDILLDADDNQLWRRAWQSNVIVVDCRRLLTGFLRGAPTVSQGIIGLLVGAGLEAWDAPPGLPTPDPSQNSLVDPHPFLLPRADLKFDFLTGAVVSTSPTVKLQIVAELGPNNPPWPDANHSSSILREFGLVAQLDGTNVLINYRNHPAIDKDPTSTLERTIWLEL
jgi:hypothetical protein